jgi:hypothetical protein
MSRQQPIAKNGVAVKLDPEPISSTLISVTKDAIRIPRAQFFADDFKQKEADIRLAELVESIEGPKPTPTLPPLKVRGCKAAGCDATHKSSTGFCNAHAHLQARPPRKAPRRTTRTWSDGQTVAYRGMPKKHARIVEAARRQEQARQQSIRDALKVVSNAALIDLARAGDPVAQMLTWEAVTHIADCDLRGFDSETRDAAVARTFKLAIDPNARATFDHLRGSFRTWLTVVLRSEAVKCLARANGQSVDTAVDLVQSYGNDEDGKFEFSRAEQPTRYDSRGWPVIPGAYDPNAEDDDAPTREDVLDLVPFAKLTKGERQLFDAWLAVDPEEWSTRRLDDVLADKVDKSPSRVREMWASVRTKICRARELRRSK